MTKRDDSVIDHNRDEGSDYAVPRHRDSRFTE